MLLSLRLKICLPVAAFVIGLILCVSGGREQAAATALAVPSCGATWEVDPSTPIPGGLLRDVAIISDTDVWAVGGYWPSGQSLIEHWDGATWSIVPPGAAEDAKGAPEGGLEGGLYGVSAIATDDVWAVGDNIQHWDGTSWSVVLQAGRNYAVAALAPDDVWVVGNSIRHWDGAAWSIVPSPAGTLQDIVAISPTDIWAVGSAYGPTLVVHWDGSAWSSFAVPGGGSDHLMDVSASSSNDVWATGYTYNGGTGSFANLVEHWDGTSWQLVASPNKGTGDNMLEGVVALSVNDAWAVGHYEYGSRMKSLLEHWNGVEWSIVGNPYVNSYNYQLFGVGAIAGNNVWAVGINFPTGGQPQTFIERYNPYPCPPTATPTPAVIACGPEWREITSPYIEDVYNIKLESVDALSADDAWAVGVYWDGSPASKQLLEHWNGREWGIVPDPVISPTDHVELYSVAAISPNDVWAVGQYGGREVVSRPVLEHWNGTSWSADVRPDAERGKHLTAIAGISSNDVWAVGNFNIGGGINHTYIEHWNGSSWTVVPSPNPSGTMNLLKSVVAISSNDVWAVGTTQAEIIALHWNGVAWSVVPTPNPGPFENSLQSISAVSGSDVWAVGSACEYSCVPLIEHWNGSAWNVLSVPVLQSNYNLTSVTAISSSDVWIVGGIYATSGQSPEPLTLHWDGATWTIVPSPSIGAVGTVLLGVAASASNDVWAVGYADINMWHDLHTAIERFSLVACPPTPTPEPPRCPSERFTDVCPGDYFYPHVLDLNDMAVLSGYNSSPPCEGAAYVPCFKPYNWSTRGQIAKVVSLAAGFSDDPGEQKFEDVPLGQTFYSYIGRMANRGIINGYPCGGANEPCGSANLPYFRPGGNVSRGQLAKMAALAFGISSPATGRIFEDVAPGYTFFEYIERLAERSIINGYDCGNPEPCVPPDNRPYYRPANVISRGQSAKIVNLARLQTMPTVTPTVEATSTFTATPASTSTLTFTPTPGVEPTTPTITATPTAIK